MVKTEKIQQAIMRLNGGQFQELMDQYLYKKYKFTNITCLGTKVGTSKTTKGTPDTYTETEDGKYILIMYGTVEEEPFKKLKKDIEDAYNTDKTHIEEDKIEEVICCYTSNNINISQREELKKIFDNKKVELIGIDDLSYDIANNFPIIADTYLDIKVDSGQFSDIDEFIKKHDKNSINAPLDIDFLERNEKKDILEILNDEDIVLLIGKAGVGKTRLAIEVCREYINNKEINCICIKNNGNDIYDDLVDYIENGREYLIFIDDINEMYRVKTFMDFIKDKRDTCKIKIIATVRDYALENVLIKLEEYYFPKIYIVNSMEDEQIKKILKDTYSIRNQHYQEKILEVSNGNPRLAILAAKGIIDGKINSLNSVFDIFQSYYFPVISNNELNEKDIKCMFLISLLGPISLEDEVIVEIIKKFDIDDKEEFIKITQKLNKLELVDYFEGKATKISDQNFGNYIVYKILMEDKKISLSNLIKKLYPSCILKIINAINMIYGIFYTKKNEEYIISEVKDVWSKEPYFSDSRFLYHFYNVDRTKSLKIIKNEIDDEETKTINLKDFDFNGNKNNQRIDNKRIEILSNFKYGELNIEAIELLIEYYKKRPDLIMEFYFGFVLNLGIDEHSLGNKYKSELNIIEIFMNIISKEDDFKYNLSYLLIKIIANFLEFDRHITKQSRKKLTLNMIRVQLVANENVYNFRCKLFKALEQLYKIDELKSMIEDLLLNYDIYPSCEDSKNILKKDMEILIDKFFNKWENPSFIQCEILKDFKHKCIIANIDIHEILENYKKNEEYLIVHTLKHERDLGENWEKAEEERRYRVKEMVKDYTVSDFSNLFYICSNAEKYQKRLNMFNVNSSILDIFDYIIDEKEETFLKIFEEYINNNAPFISYPDILISKILQKYNCTDVLKILESNDNDKKYCYLKGYYKSISKITDKDISNIFDLLDIQKYNEQVYILDIKSLFKYEKVKKGIIEKYCMHILSNYSKKTYVISDFFGHIFNLESEEIKFIIESFENIEILENLYILGSYNFMDNNGKLGIEILKRDNNFIYKIIDNMKDFQTRSSELDNIFNEIWKLADYEKYIKMAFEELEKQSFYYFEIEKVFSGEQGEREEILLRKMKWIEDYIQNNYKNIKKICCIFDVICTSFPNKKKEYILKYLKLNKSIEDFKKIPLFSNFSSWSGSEVPLIDKKIKFLNDLNNSIAGLDYIDHRDYINSRLALLKKYKIDIKIREYLEEYL